LLENVVRGSHLSKVQSISLELRGGQPTGITPGPIQMLLFYMLVRVDQPGRHSLPLQINPERVRAGQAEHLVVGSHRCNLAAANCHGLRGAEVRIHGEDLPVVQNRVGSLLGRSQMDTSEHRESYQEKTC